MIRFGRGATVFFLLLLGACASSAPTAPAKVLRDAETNRFAAGVQALCFGRSVEGPEDIREDVMRACPKGSDGFEILHQDSFWNSCPLLQPVRITYQCGPVAEQ